MSLTPDHLEPVSRDVNIRRAAPLALHAPRLAGAVCPRRSFTKELKAEVVALVRQSGNTAARVARDLDLTETAVRDWVKQADIDDGDRDA